MEPEQAWGATASLNGSIQSLREQVADQRNRAIKAEARDLAAQRKLVDIDSIVSYVFASPALAINTPLVKFAAAVCKIITGEEI